MKSEMNGPNLEKLGKVVHGLIQQNRLFDGSKIENLEMDFHYH